jgi:GntR family transcriptional regulator
VPGLLQRDLQGSLYELLGQEYRLRLEHAAQTIMATVVEPDDARLLNVPAFSPAFRVERTGYDARGRAIERAESLYRADRYSYQVTLNRRS